MTGPNTARAERAREGHDVIIRNLERDDDLVTLCCDGCSWTDANEPDKVNWYMTDSTIDGALDEMRRHVAEEHPDATDIVWPTP